MQTNFDLLYIGTYTRRTNAFGYHFRIEEIPYSEYIKHRALTEYVDYYYASLGHPWTWGIFLKKMQDSLDSGWITEMTGSMRGDLLAIEVEDCEVSLT